jgi:hypothetical protein
MRRPVRKSGSKVMSETLEIPLDNLKEWLEQETSSLIEPLKAEGTDRLNNNRDKLNNLHACILASLSLLI